MMTWDVLLNGSAASQASNIPEDFKVISTHVVVHACGTKSEIVLVRERSQFKLIHGDYTECFRTKKAAVAALAEQGVK